MPVVRWCLNSCLPTRLASQATAFSVKLRLFSQASRLSSQAAAFPVKLLPYGRSSDSSSEMHLPVKGRGGNGLSIGGRARLGWEGNEGGVFQLQGEHPPVLQQITCKVWDRSLPACLNSLAFPVLDTVFGTLSCQCLQLTSVLSQQQI